MGSVQMKMFLCFLFFTTNHENLFDHWFAIILLLHFFSSLINGFFFYFFNFPWLSINNMTWDVKRVLCFHHYVYLLWTIAFDIFMNWLHPSASVTFLDINTRMGLLFFFLLLLLLLLYYFFSFQYYKRQVLSLHHAHV